MDWKGLVVQAFQQQAGGPISTYPRFSPGASEAALTEAEQRLGMTIPEDLRALLAQCDGIMDVMVIEGNHIDNQWVIWPLETILEANLDPERGVCGLPPDWLVFASADGHDIGYDGDAQNGQIWIWHPIDDESEQIASSFADFLLRGFMYEFR